MRYVFCGTLVHSTSETMMDVCHDGIMGVDNDGKIAFIDNAANIDKLAQKYGFECKNVIYLKPARQFLIPGFIDTHIHAPQYVFTGTGYDLPLLQWLGKYTFPAESKFGSPEFAEHAYRKVVARLLKNGTTTASYFATIHYEATQILCNVVAEFGQRGYIGKVSMDQNSPDYYIETTKQAIEDAERFVKHVLELQNPMITPVVTPRFVISCTSELMKQLGHVSEKYNVPIQTHINETKNEIILVKNSFPDDSYTAVYDKHNLLNSKTYMAHCCHSSEEELHLMLERSSAVAHCPTSNFNIRSGIADIRGMLNKKIKVGLGTDVSGGESPSMLVAIRDCVKASNVLSLGRSKEYQPLSLKDAFFLATLGGSQVLGLDGKIGNFEVLSDQLIDRMHKWRPISYSFVVMLIILTGVILMKIFFVSFFMPMTLVRMISILLRMIYWPPCMRTAYIFTILFLKGAAFYLGLLFPEREATSYVANISDIILFSSENHVQMYTCSMDQLLSQVLVFFSYHTIHCHLTVHETKYGSLDWSKICALSLNSE